MNFRYRTTSKSKRWPTTTLCSGDFHDNAGLYKTNVETFVTDAALLGSVHRPWPHQHTNHVTWVYLKKRMRCWSIDFVHWRTIELLQVGSSPYQTVSNSWMHDVWQAPDHFHWLIAHLTCVYSKSWYAEPEYFWTTYWKLCGIPGFHLLRFNFALSRWPSRNF